MLGSVRRYLTRKTLATVATYSILGSWSLVCLFPLYWVAVTSLKGEFEIVRGPLYLPFVDFVPTLDSWRYILRDVSDNLVLEFFNSVAVAVSSTFLTVAFGALAVYGLTRFEYRLTWIVGAVVLLLAALFASWVFFYSSVIALPFAVAIGLLLLLRRRLSQRGVALSKNTIFAGFWATRILPPVVVVLPIYVVVQRTGLLDTLLSLILTYGASNLPIAIWLLRPAFGERVTEQEEAARMDGASNLRIFSTILVPTALAGIAATSLLIFILSWNEYLFAAYLSAGRSMTVPPWVIGQLSMKEAAVGGDIEEWSRLSGAMVLMITPMLAFAVFAQPFLGRISKWHSDTPAPR